MENKRENTIIADYERLYADVLILKGLYRPLAEELLDSVPARLQLSVSAFSDLIDKVVEDMENSYTVCECGVG